MLTSAISAYAQAEGKFYKDTDYPGYWWKKDPAEEKKEEEKQAKKQKMKQASEPDDVMHMADFTDREIYDMYPDQFTKLLDDTKKLGVQRPTEENVANYLKMQDIARRKAVEFSNVAQYTILKHPELSLERDNPTSGPGEEARRVVRKDEIEQMIDVARDDFGLVYFSKKGCPYCESEKKVLRFITNKGWKIKEVDIEDRPDIAATFNITVTPSLLLIKRGSTDYLPMSYGVISYEELGEKIYAGVRLLNGEITPDQFNMRESERGGGFDPKSILGN
jgi:conjugal transfer pilus assembly protein TraF